MAALHRTYSTIVYAMAFIAGATLVWLMISTIVSVLMRNLGLQPPAWLFTSAEYGILYMTMLGAPWLVREKGHVHIELVTSALPPARLNVTSDPYYGPVCLTFPSDPVLCFPHLTRCCVTPSDPVLCYPHLTRCCVTQSDPVLCYPT